MKSKQRVVYIVADTSYNPRIEGGNHSTIVWWHKHYALGDVILKSRKEADRWLKEVRENEEVKFVGKLYFLADGQKWEVRMDRGFEEVDPAKKTWSLAGYLVVTDVDMRDGMIEPTEENARKIAEREMEAFAKYVRGDVWELQVFDRCLCCGSEIPVENHSGILGYSRAMELAKSRYPDAEIRGRSAGDD